MFKEAFLYAQNREDINDYGVIGFGRYERICWSEYYSNRDCSESDTTTTASKATDGAKDKLSLCKCVLVNVNKTRGTNYISGLKKVMHGLNDGTGQF